MFLLVWPRIRSTVPMCVGDVKRFDVWNWLGLVSSSAPTAPQLPPGEREARGFEKGEGAAVEDIRDRQNGRRRRVAEKSIGEEGKRAVEKEKAKRKP